MILMAPFHASIRIRLTIWFVLLLALVLVAFGSGVYLLMRHSLYQSLEESIESRAGTLFELVQFEEGRPYLEGQGLVAGLDPGERLNRLYDRNGSLTFDDGATNSNIPVNSDAVAKSLAGESVSYRARGGPEAEVMRLQTFSIFREGRAVGVLEVGQSEDDVSETLAILVWIMGIAYPLTLLLASLGGVFLAGRALAPVDEITSLARRLSAGGLGQRLNLPPSNDELGRLAQTFDEMIARLDEAFRRQRQFAADASHEMRTPLTIIKGQIDVSLQMERNPVVYREVLQGVNEEVDRLIRLAGSLLTLTRADAGQIPLMMEIIDVGDIVAGILDQVRPAAEAKQVNLQFSGGPPASIQADEDLLLQLMLNLVDNAVKYTPSGGWVNVGWTANDGQVTLRVADNGVGIQEEHHQYIFDRFYRVDKARGRAEGGVGLGLAISRWITEAHDGRIWVDSAPGEGSTFTVVLPAVH